MVSLQDIQDARARIRGVALRTPLVEMFLPATGEGQPDGRRLFLKAENLQPIGSFKLRGGYNKIASLTPQERSRGVISYSSGNHAQAVAYSARAMGVPSVLVMPRTAPAIKLANTRALGAEIVLVGPGSQERQSRAEELAAEHGYAIIPPYNDEQIIAGQGTIGLEILEDLAAPDVVLAPIGGGGLISGIAAALKQSRPSVKVIGVESELVGKAQASLRAGKIVAITAEQAARTIADGLRTQTVGVINFAHIQAYVDDIVTVSEEEIREAMRRMVFASHLVPEPSGAVTLAAFLFHSGELPESATTVAVVSGGSVEPEMLRQVLAAPSTI